MPLDQAHYELCIANGCSPRMAEMLACQQAPGLRQGTVFHGMDDGFGESSVEKMARNIYRRKAQAAGVNPEGKKYVPALAAFPGDPQAWVSSTGDMKRVVKERNWGAEGIVENKTLYANAAPKDDKDYEVADDIVEQVSNQEIAKEGVKLTPKERRQVKAKVKNRLKPSWAR